jgi:hypothetical protein
MTVQHRPRVLTGQPYDERAARRRELWRSLRNALLLAAGGAAIVWMLNCP